MSGGVTFEPGAILNALAEPVFVIDGADRLRYTNPATEQFFKSSAQALLGRALVELLPEDSPVFTLIRQVRRGGHSVTEYGVTVDTPRTGSPPVGSLQLAGLHPHPSPEGWPEAAPR